MKRSGTGDPPQEQEVWRMSAAIPLRIRFAGSGMAWLEYSCKKLFFPLLTVGCKVTGGKLKPWHQPCWQYDRDGRRNNFKSDWFGQTWLIPPAVVRKCTAKNRCGNPIWLLQLFRDPFRLIRVSKQDILVEKKNKNANYNDKKICSSTFR